MGSGAGNQSYGRQKEELRGQEGDSAVTQGSAAARSHHCQLCREGSREKAAFPSLGAMPLVGAGATTQAVDSLPPTVQSPAGPLIF